MPSLTQIAITPDLTFDAMVAGEPGAPLVLLLHGFAESMNCWRAQVAALADMGYRALAPSQRGYSKGARPDPRDASHYHIDRLMDDAMAIVTASGYGEARLGRQHCLGACRSLSGTDRVADHPVASASERIQSRAADGGRRSGATL